VGGGVFLFFFVPPPPPPPPKKMMCCNIATLNSSSFEADIEYIVCLNHPDRFTNFTYSSLPG
jgi:hypothetical protein